MIHGIDGQEDDDYPWRVCPKSSMGCGFLSDRMSISVIYKGKTATFSGGGGVILSPDATRVLCAYGGDGGTRGKLCHPPGLTAQCVPGCMMGQGSYEAWCEPGPNDYWCDGHPWRPEELGTFLQRDRISQQYNEIIVDGFYWNEKLPRSIEAILTSPGDPQAAKTHAAFLATYNLTADDVPLLSFNKADGNAPFVLEQALVAYGGESAPAAAAPAASDSSRTGDISALGFGRK